MDTTAKSTPVGTAGKQEQTADFFKNLAAEAPSSKSTQKKQQKEEEKKQKEEGKKQKEEAMKQQK